MKIRDFPFRAFTRLEQLEYPIRTRQIDVDVFWAEPARVPEPA